MSAKSPFAIAAAERRKQRLTGYQCWYERIVPQLTAKQRRELNEALDDIGIGHRTIAKVLSHQWNIRVHESAIGRHRRGDCVCGR